MPYKDPTVRRIKNLEANRRWREKDREAHAAYMRKFYRRRKQRLQDLKRGLECVRCGFDDFRALEFHHRDPSEKVFTLSQAWNKSEADFRAEIAKCDVLCANCHAIEHYIRSDAYSDFADVV